VWEMGVGVGGRGEGGGEEEKMVWEEAGITGRG
jgi:hypothetical protein